MSSLRNFSLLAFSLIMLSGCSSTSSPGERAMIGGLAGAGIGAGAAAATGGSAGAGAGIGAAIGMLVGIIAE